MHVKIATCMFVIIIEEASFLGRERLREKYIKRYGLKLREWKNLIDRET